jgi:hypothetical protein
MGRCAGRPEHDRRTMRAALSGIAVDGPHAQGRSGLMPPGLFAFSSAHFLAALVLLIFLSPFISESSFGPTIEITAITLVMLMGTLAVGRRKVAMAFAALFCIPAVVIRLAEHYQSDSVPGYLLPVISLLFIILVIFELTRFILRAPRIDHEVVCASIASFISMGFAWTAAFLLVARLSPEAFAVYGRPVQQIAPYELAYFSFVTLTGVAYGDITPLSRFAQMLVVLEGLTGTFYIIILIGRLVALYSSRKPAHPHELPMEQP